MLNTCDSNHEKICFDGYDCPACKLQEEIEKLKDQLTELDDDFNKYILLVKVKDKVEKMTISV